MKQKVRPNVPRPTHGVFRFLIFLICVIGYFAGLGFNHQISSDISQGTYAGTLPIGLIVTIVSAALAAFFFFRFFSYSNGWVFLCASSYSLGYLFPSAPRPPSFFAWLLPMIWVAIILVARMTHKR